MIILSSPAVAMHRVTIALSSYDACQLCDTFTGEDSTGLDPTSASGVLLLMAILFLSLSLSLLRAPAWVAGGGGGRFDDG